MPIDITVTDISGQTPFDLWVCDTGATYCVYAATINSVDLPYTFEVPVPFSSSIGVNLKIIDQNNCIINQILLL